ncbi:MAG: type VI secretion system lipoprotein TssJ [Methylococcales bacterium]
MKQIFSIPLVTLTCIGLSGCCVFSETIPVEGAQVFVNEAFQVAMSEVAKIKLRPSKVALSFYADKDVNSVMKKRKKEKASGRLTLQAIEEPVPPITQVRTGQTERITELITYKLQCERTQSVTFIKCQPIGLSNLGLADNRQRLNIKEIVLRQQNRLNILIQSDSDSSTSTNKLNKYNLQCDRHDPEIYQNCLHIPGTSASTSAFLGKTPFSIQQVNMTFNNSQFEVLVKQTVDRQQQAPAQIAYQAPVTPPPAEEEWIETYVDPKPISFKILMLRDDSLLLSADIESLTTDLKKTLGQNYIDHDDYVLTPGEFKFINYSRVDPETRYVAVIADYRDAGNAIWKKAYKVEPTGSTYPLHVHLRRNAVDILAEGE